MAHRCKIDITNDDPHYRGNPGYLVVCDECGQVGQPHDRPRDAQVVANRHEQVQGFER